MPIGRPAMVNTLWVPGGISATGATTNLCMVRGLSDVLTPSPLAEHRGAIASHPTRLEAEPTICCTNASCLAALNYERSSSAPVLAAGLVPDETARVHRAGVECSQTIDGTVQPNARWRKRSQRRGLCLAAISRAGSSVS